MNFQNGYSCYGNQSNFKKEKKYLGIITAEHNSWNFTGIIFRPCGISWTYKEEKESELVGQISVAIAMETQKGEFWNFYRVSKSSRNFIYIHVNIYAHVGSGGGVG